MVDDDLVLYSDRNVLDVVTIILRMFVYVSSSRIMCIKTEIMTVFLCCFMIHTDVIFMFIVNSASL